MPCRRSSTGSSRDRGEKDGSVSFHWKNTRGFAAPAAVGEQEWGKFVKKGLVKAEEYPFRLRDFETGKPVIAHGGSINWNEYRKRWVLIAVEMGGTSFLGEVWFAEADAPSGPWVFGDKIVTHDRYSFYNPKHHPFFDKEGGRVLFFEGTYANTFSGNPAEPTPRYDYNQIMYKLDLGDRRLNLPVAVYNAPKGLATMSPGDEVAFFALDRPAPGTIAIARAHDGRLRVAEKNDAVLFHAYPPGIENRPQGLSPLHEYHNAEINAYAYSIEPLAGFARVEKPLCLVWRKPLAGRYPAD